MLQQTPLNPTHRDMGARMVDFGGWDMPVSYGSQMDEHHAVRRDAGTYDGSPMRAVDRHGEGARGSLRTPDRGRAERPGSNERTATHRNGLRPRRGRRRHDVHLRRQGHERFWH